MPFIPWDWIVRRMGKGILLCAMLASAASRGIAQSVPVPVPQDPSRSPGAAAPAAYRLPTIALVQPADGATLPQDRPIVMFRFAPGEPNDPLDLASFAVSVDGVDRRGLFHLTAGEAWGPLVVSPNDEPAPAGVHQLTARICSARGACAFVATTVTVVATLTSQPAAPGTVADSTTSAPSRRRRVIDALLAAVRKLLDP